MTTVPWIGVAAILALAVTFWSYGLREERVAGRVPAAMLRAGALFLAFSAPWLPDFGTVRGREGHTAVLVDRSLSMSLPSKEATAETRMQRAREIAIRLEEEREGLRWWVFGDSTRPLLPDSIPFLRPSDRRSRLAEALERARLEGADSVILVTDGDLTDRESSRRLAADVGLTVRELQVAESLDRHVLRRIDAPSSAAAGDTVEIRAEVVGTGGDDSVRVELHRDGVELTHDLVPSPSSGRAVSTVLRARMPPGDGESDWVAFDVRIGGAVEPRDPAARRRTWVRIAPAPPGAVVVSTTPDWEVRYLLPLLRRASPGGAEGYLRMRDGRYLRAGSDVRGVAEGPVRRAAEGAFLLVVQGRPEALPDWLSAAAARRPAVLALAKGSGRVPGTAVATGDPVPGEWYAVTPPPPGPVAPYLVGLEVARLPPLLELHGSSGRVNQAVLGAARDRRGVRRPIAVIGTTGDRRWAVVLGEGTWRWAARAHEGTNLYRGLYGGLAGWLLERATSDPVRLDDPAPTAGEALRWRVAPDVRDLAVELRDAGGDVIWSDSLEVPPPLVSGTGLDAGDARFVARGTGRDGPFRVDRPFHVGPPDELLPGPAGPPLDIVASRIPESDRRPGPGLPPAWPFAAAALLLCAEWIWRRRVGLR